MSETQYSGILELEDRGRGKIRTISKDFAPSHKDVRISPKVISEFGLREGCFITGVSQRKGKNLESVRIDTVNDLPPEHFKDVPELTKQIAISPNERLVLETSDPTTRILDLIAPIGRGQRALIVAPPRSGKTVLMQRMAQAVSKNYPELEMLILLVDERPEEVTEMERATQAKVFASSNDRDFASHSRIARLTLEYAKRKAEVGKDIVILLDSLTRVGRAYNAGMKGSGRIMSGGIDARALEIPKRIFGASRNIEDGGSLTIIATILVDTGSRMDELIFQEFKGTGNSEIVLDRELSDQRIFPALNIQLTGTRREELLLGDDTELHFRLRRALLEGGKRDAMQGLQNLVRRTRSNKELLEYIKSNDKLDLVQPRRASRKEMEF